MQAMGTNYLPPFLDDCTPSSPAPPLDLEATTPTNLPIDHLSNVLASQVTPLLDPARHPEPPAFELPSNASAPKRPRPDDGFEEEYRRAVEDAMRRITGEATRRKLAYRAELKKQKDGRGSAAEISSRREAKVSRQFQAFLRQGLEEEVRKVIRENLKLKYLAYSGLIARKKVKVEDTSV